MNTQFADLTEHWHSIAPWVAMPHSDSDYQKKLGLLNQLIDLVGENEQHPLASLLNFVGILVSEYEKAHVTPPEATPQQVLAFLMQEHQLKQSDLPEIGSQGVVSEILSGKRQLNTRQIKALAERFAVSSSVFI